LGHKSQFSEGNGVFTQLQAWAGGPAGAELGGRITNQTTLMSAPILDPSLPADNSLITSGELRGQFQAIADKLDELIKTLNAGAGY
jgi:hypothetical protein